MEEFGKRLRELRTEKGLSAMALSKIVNVSDGSIIGWENNRYDIKSEYLIRLSKFFGVSTDYLLG